MPTHSLARAERGKEFFFAMPQGGGHIKRGRKECGTIGIRQHESVFRRQQVPVAVDVEPHITPGNLPVKPFADGTLVGRGTECEFMRSDWATLRHCAIKAEFV